MPTPGGRITDGQAAVEGPRPYSPIGIIPEGSKRPMVGLHGNSQAIPYVSDAPYVPPSYNERPECDGTRTNGQPCHAKAEPDSTRCRSHQL